MKTIPAFLFASTFMATATITPAVHAGEPVTLRLVNTVNATQHESVKITLAAGESAEMESVKMPEMVNQVYFYTDVDFSLIFESPGVNALTLKTYRQAPYAAIPKGSSSTQADYAGPPEMAKIKLAGPGVFYLKAPSLYTSVFATFNVTRVNAPTVTPSNAAVIPEDASGQYQVILESSTDMITWTAANPGTYAGTTAKRFFRTRIVKL